MPRRAPRAERVHGEVEGRKDRTFAEVWALVRRIPRGRVMTYGQIAVLLGSRLSPRAVGWAMHGCPKNVPWQRVVNARGGCSTDHLPGVPTGLQRAMLEAEGIEFRANGTMEVERHRYAPPRWPRDWGKHTPPERRKSRQV